MNMIYNSPNYCVVEFGAGDLERSFGFEIMDKNSRREIFLNGSLAAQFRASVQELIASEPTFEEIDDYLSQFDPLMSQAMTLH